MRKKLKQVVDITFMLKMLRPKFNLVGPEEMNNLTLAQMIAKVQKKNLCMN